ncbi:hypothetical protein G9O61_00g000590 [Vairimorpha ceranae]|nr:hypothetical protein G9O61_00g000590 [Vairimorpha ceranae]
MTGLVERLNRTYLEKLKKVLEFGRKDCYGCIGAATKAYMLSSNWTLKCSPSELKIGDLVCFKDSSIFKHRLSPDYNIAEKIIGIESGVVTVVLITGRNDRSNYKDIKAGF